MSERPEIPVGYLGAQPKFSDLRLQTLTHDNPEFTVDQNSELEIKFKMPRPIKVRHFFVKQTYDMYYLLYNCLFLLLLFFCIKCRNGCS